MTDDLREQLAALNAAQDQLREHSKAIAAIASAYFGQLVELGLTREEALKLTEGYQAIYAGWMMGLFPRYDAPE